MKKINYHLAVTIIMMLFLIGCNQADQKKEKTEGNADSSNVTVTDPVPPGNNVADGQRDANPPTPYVVSIEPQFRVEGGDGKDWDTQITLNIINEGQNIANLDGQTCCNSGRPGGSPNPTDWNKGDLIPSGIKTLPRYIINRADITKEMLSNSDLYMGWRPVGRDASDGIRWTITATFSDNSRAVYSKLETFANTSAFQSRQSKLRDNIK